MDDDNVIIIFKMGRKVREAFSTIKAKPKRKKASSYDHSSLSILLTYLFLRQAGLDLLNLLHPPAK